MPIVGGPVKTKSEPISTIEPYWQTSDKQTVKLYLGDVLDVLRGLPRKSVHCVVTSPPYWALRDYGTAEWEGGDIDCDHLRVNDRRAGVKQVTNTGTNQLSYTQKCGKCGAKSIDKQIGSEETPDEFVAKLVEVFRWVKRALRDDGTLWLNLGDSYGQPSRWGGNNALSEKQASSKGTLGPHEKPNPETNLKPGNLVGIPWRVALAMQADGWILRQDIIWQKPSCMPESISNRCTKSHEYIFLFAKSQKYFYDMEAIREKTGSEVSDEDYQALLQLERDRNEGWYQGRDGRKDPLGTGLKAGLKTRGVSPPNGRNKRSVWTITDPSETVKWIAENCPEALDAYLVASGIDKPDVWRVSSPGYSGAHYAVFPRKLIEPCILAGTSSRGCCTQCGAPWRQVVEEKRITRDRPNDYVKRTGETGTGNSCANSVAGVSTTTYGWYPTCDCDDLPSLPDEPAWGKDFNRRKRVLGTIEQVGQSGQDILFDEDREHKRYTETPEYKTWIDECKSLCDRAADIVTVPCVVLDPFIGSGTTCCVSLENGRHSVGIDLSKTYLDNNAIPRIEGELLSRPTTYHLAGKETEAIDMGEDME